MSRRFTFIYIPESGKQVRRLVVSRSMANAMLGLLLLVGAVLGYIVVDYFNLQFDQQQFKQLLVENSEQRQQLGKLNRDLNDLRDEVMVLAESDARVRDALDVPTENVANVPVGIGGALDNNTSDMSELQKQINRLRLDIDLRREAQEEVRNLLNDKHSLASATPGGWPTKGWLTSYFGMRPSPYSAQRKMHEGLDIAANIGTAVRATADGIVVKSTLEPGFGKVVMIDHGYGYRTIYGHNSRLLVKAGAHVKRGDKIAEVGNTGRSTGTHLHYEVHLNGAPIDPRKLL